VKIKCAETPGVIWRKAAVLGSLWAASEIIMGSFLHNAHMPFSGEFLTVVGIIIMAAGYRLWPERGLLWRASLVCAAMKSISPSAVILGPMFAISSEGFLAEAGLRLLGANPAGYLLAGGLAMCGTLVYKLVRLFMIYGPDTVQVYLRGVEWLRGLGLSGANEWAPLAAVCGIYFLAGGAAAMAGLAAGRKEHRTGPDLPKPAVKPAPASAHQTRSYSAWALAAHIIFVAAVMAAGRRLPPLALAAAAGIYAYACARFYPRAGALLRRAGIWAGVLLASLVAGLVLGSSQAGLYMALRAFLLTMGFAAIGEELLNPAIRRLLERRGGSVFFETLEYAFSALPGIIAGLPSGREFARRPLAALGGAVARAPFLLDALSRAPVFIITGAQGGGKSELVLKLAELLRAAGKKPGGIRAEGFWENGLRSGFDLIDISSGARAPLCRRGPGGRVRAGEFRFSEEGLAAGYSALSAAGLSGAEAVFVDEIGFLELEGGGWAAPLRDLAHGSAPLVLVVRDYLVERVSADFELHRPVIWKVGEITADAALFELLAALELPKK
jgi:nucleoside-triphosphatase THEP1